MTTKVSKNLLDTVYVTADGTTPVTGTLVVNAASPTLQLTSTGTSSGTLIWKNSSSGGNNTAIMYANSAEFKTVKYSDAGVIQTTLTIGTDGNVTLSGGAEEPTSSGHLTRKDYVDDTTVSITGDTMTGDLNLGDNDHVIFGAGSDLDIFSNGTNSTLKFISGGLFFESASSVTVAAFSQTAATLYFSSSPKLATTTTGVTINGALTESDIDFTAYSENANSIATTGAVTLNASLATYFYNTATTGIITFTFSGAAATGRVTTMTLELFGGGTNAPVWPASVDWPAGTEPTWTTGVDVVSFITRDGGTTWLGMLGGTAFA